MENVNYGFAYVEDIQRFLRVMGGFTIEECDRCRKACCKNILGERQAFRDKFIEHYNEGVLLYNVDAGKMFDLATNAYGTAVHKSHTAAYLFQACRIY